MPRVFPDHRVTSAVAIRDFSSSLKILFKNRKDFFKPERATICKLFDLDSDDEEDKNLLQAEKNANHNCKEENFKSF